jgi:hypothetical protein
MKILSLVCGLALGLSSLPARAESGRTDALTELAKRVAATNPNPNPDGMDGLSGQLTKCLYGAEQMAGVEQILNLFIKYDVMRDYDTAGEGSTDQLKEAIGKLPSFSNRENDPTQQREYDRLCTGIGFAPGVTYRSLVRVDCRSLLGMHFDKGATREDLLNEIRKDRSELESVEAPNP